MRIVAGRFRGRVLAAPEGMATRPTAERAREALFNILAHAEPSLDGAHVLDVFAGSGALGLEALSRGAAHASFIESDGAALAIIGTNVRKLGVADQANLIRVDAARPPKAARPCQFVFLDPPYKSGLAAQVLPALAAQGWIDTNALIVVEVAAGEGFTAPTGLAVTDERKYGAARLVFLRRSTSPS